MLFLTLWLFIHCIFSHCKFEKLNYLEDINIVPHVMQLWDLCMHLHIWRTLNCNGIQSRGGQVDVRCFGDEVGFWSHWSVFLFLLKCVFDQAAVRIWSRWSVFLIKLQCVFDHAEVDFWSHWSGFFITLQFLFYHIDVCFFWRWSVYLLTLECVFRNLLPFSYIVPQDIFNHLQPWKTRMPKINTFIPQRK